MIFVNLFIRNHSHSHHHINISDVCGHRLWATKKLQQLYTIHTGGLKCINVTHLANRKLVVPCCCWWQVKCASVAQTHDHYKYKQHIVSTLENYQKYTIKSIIAIKVTKVISIIMLCQHSPINQVTNSCLLQLVIANISPECCLIRMLLHRRNCSKSDRTRKFSSKEHFQFQLNIYSVSHSFNDQISIIL